MTGTGRGAVRRFADRVTVARLPGAARERPGPRVSSEMLIVFVESGRGSYWHGGTESPTEPGSAFVTAPDVPHDVSGLWSTRGWLIEFPVGVVGMAERAPGRFRPSPGHPAWLSFIRPMCLSGRLELGTEAKRRWVLRARALTRDLTERSLGYNQLVAAYLTLMLIDAARLALPAVHGAGQREAPLLQAAFDAIESHFDAAISLDGVAERVGVSGSHLARVVKAATGRTVNQWIAERRMVEARRRLLQSDEKVDAVGRQVGYRDPAYFRRQFRAMHGTPPAAWRRAHREAGRSDQGAGRS